MAKSPMSIRVMCVAVFLTVSVWSSAYVCARARTFICCVYPLPAQSRDHVVTIALLLSFSVSISPPPHCCQVNMDDMDVFSHGKRVCLFAFSWCGLSCALGLKGGVHVNDKLMCAF